MQAKSRLYSISTLSSQPIRGPSIDTHPIDDRGPVSVRPYLPCSLIRSSRWDGWYGDDNMKLFQTAPSTFALVQLPCLRTGPEFSRPPSCPELSSSRAAWIGFSSKHANRALVVWRSHSQPPRAVAYDTSSGATAGLSPDLVPRDMDDYAYDGLRVDGGVNPSGQLAAIAVYRTAFFEDQEMHVSLVSMNNGELLQNITISMTSSPSHVFIRWAPSRPYFYLHAVCPGGSYRYASLHFSFLEAPSLRKAFQNEQLSQGSAYAFWCPARDLCMLTHARCVLQLGSETSPPSCHGLADCTTVRGEDWGSCSPCGRLFVTRTSRKKSKDNSRQLEHWTMEAPESAGPLLLRTHIVGDRELADSWELKVAWNPQPASGQICAICNDKGQIHIIDGSQHQKLHTWVLPDHYDTDAMLWSPDGLCLAVVLHREPCYTEFIADNETPNSKNQPSLLSHNSLICLYQL